MEYSIYTSSSNSRLILQQRFNKRKVRMVKEVAAVCEATAGDWAIFVVKAVFNWLWSSRGFLNNVFN